MRGPGRSSGGFRWTHYKNQFGNGSRSTPAVYKGTAYALSPHGKLFAVDAREGATRWVIDLVKEYSARVPDWGVSTSPVLLGDRLLINNCGTGGHGVIALDRSTGQLAWASESESDSYSTPVIATIGGVEQALVFKADALISVATEDGRRLWSYPWKSNMGQSNATPVYIEPDRVFISSYSDSLSAMVHVVVEDGRFHARKDWHYNKMWNHHSTSIHLDGYVYGFHRDILKCLDAETHEEKWVKRGFGHGTLVYADGHFFVQGEKGQLALIEATPTSYSEKALVRVLGDKCWTVPTLANGRLYVRDEKSIVCLDVVGEAN